MNEFVQKIEQELLPSLILISNSPFDPVQVVSLPSPWKVIGCGNYAAVFGHPSFDHVVVKVYAVDIEGIKEEKKVYEQLGEHPSYSHLYASGDTYLVLKKIKGITLYDAIHRGIYIPERIIKDIEEGLSYAEKKGLRPHDVHGKNIMMDKEKGYIVDVSDFYKTDTCRKWKDLRKAYYKIYLPLFSKITLPVPYFMLNWIRKGYRLYRQYKKRKLC